MADQDPGIIDTSVVVHAFGNDPDTASAQAFLDRVEAGGASIIVDPLVIHELTYAFSRVSRQFPRERVAEIALSLLDIGVPSMSDDALRHGIEIWRDTPGLSFVDAYLGSRALAEDIPVFSINRKDFLRQGVDAPDLREFMGTG